MADEHPRTTRDTGSPARTREQIESQRQEKDHRPENSSEGRDRPPATPDRDQNDPWLGGG